MLMLCNENGIEFRSVDNAGVLQAASWGTHEEEECTLEASAEDVRRYAGQSALNIADKVLLTILKRIPQ